MIWTSFNSIFEMFPGVRLIGPIWQIVMPSKTGYTLWLNEFFRYRLAVATIYGIHEPAKVYKIERGYEDTGSVHEKTGHKIMAPWQRVSLVAELTGESPLGKGDKNASMRA